MDHFIQWMGQFRYIVIGSSRKPALKNGLTKLRLAKQLDLPLSALTLNADLRFIEEKEQLSALPMKPFQDPNPYLEFTYPTTLMAKLAIADYLGQPLAKLG